MQGVPAGFRIDPATGAVENVFEGGIILPISPTSDRTAESSVTWEDENGAAIAFVTGYKQTPPALPSQTMWHGIAYDGERHDDSSQASLLMTVAPPGGFVREASITALVNNPLPSANGVFHGMMGRTIIDNLQRSSFCNVDLIGSSPRRGTLVATAELTGGPFAQYGNHVWSNVFSYVPAPSPTNLYQNAVLFGSFYTDFTSVAWAGLHFAYQWTPPNGMKVGVACSWPGGTAGLPYYLILGLYLVGG